MPFYVFAPPTVRDHDLQGVALSQDAVRGCKLFDPEVVT